MKIIIVLMMLMQIGCSGAAMYAINVISGITTSLAVDKLDDKLNDNKKDKEKVDDCKNCEVDKWGRIVW